MSVQLKPFVKVPDTVKKGKAFEIRTRLPHEMETGLRTDDEGNIIPRKIINKFVCKYNGEQVFSADLHPAISAHPYLAFYTVATESGTLEFLWTDDDGTIYTATVSVAVE